MPTYTFENAAGETVEAFFPMSKFPRIGEVRRFGKRTFRRILDTGRGAAPQGIVADWRFASWQTPLYDPLAPRHDALGRAAFVSKAEAREYARKTRAAGRPFDIEE